MLHLWLFLATCSTSSHFGIFATKGPCGSLLILGPQLQCLVPCLLLLSPTWRCKTQLILLLLQLDCQIPNKKRSDIWITGIKQTELEKHWPSDVMVTTQEHESHGSSNGNGKGLEHGHINRPFHAYHPCVNSIIQEWPKKSLTHK